MIIEFSHFGRKSENPKAIVQKNGRLIELFKELLGVLYYFQKKGLDHSVVSAEISIVDVKPAKVIGQCRDKISSISFSL